MSNFKRKMPAAGGPLRRDPLASLKMADMVISKPYLPAELIASVVDHLAVPDLLRFARVSRRMHEMIYEDSRWIKRLQRMGVWKDVESRTRPGLPRNDTSGRANPNVRRQSTLDRNSVNGKGRPDILVNGNGLEAVHPARRRSNVHTTHKLRAETADGFDQIDMSTTATQHVGLTSELESALSVLHRVRSVRTQARQEYAKVYQALGKYYNDALRTSTPTNCLIFRAYVAPEQQAQMLAQIQIFASSDFSPGGLSRAVRLKELIDVFDRAALLEFRKGYEYKDIQGRMRQYAHVMYILDGGQASVDLFVHDNSLLTHKANLGGVSDCIDYSLGYGQLSLERVQAYFERLGAAYSQEVAVIQIVFPSPNEVSLRLLETVGNEVLSPFLTALFEDARTRGTSMYLRVISGTFAATRQFISDFALPVEPDEATVLRANAVAAKIFEPHLESYLTQELATFKQKADAEIEQWDRALSEQAASAESYLLSNFNRQADKKDFLSSFKKVVMMPVNILPSFSGPSNPKTAAKAIVHDDHHSAMAGALRSSTPTPISRSVTPSGSLEAPTTELAAKAALMASNLESIRSLFSIEVALNLVHAAKSSLERAAQFIALSGESGEAARAKCSAIFLLLLNTIGPRHVKAGFDKAIDRLARYNPREAKADGDSSSVQVTPLATFLELVNVGDLIQQMLDVFFESELIRLQISKRDDFLDPSVKEKKKFEAMLDERVAAGLGKGIDVLMNEVEFICATTQDPLDFNPEHNIISDIGPTKTAHHVIEVVGSHTGMLTGSTDKTLLDVFTAEVGLRLWSALCKHIKRQRISTVGALPLLSDLSAYARFIGTFKNNDLNSYFTALIEVGQIYLIEGETDKDVNEMATIIADGGRYGGVFGVEEVVEFAERRSDWLMVRGRVEGKVRGESCVLM